MSPTDGFNDAEPVDGEEVYQAAGALPEGDDDGEHDDLYESMQHDPETVDATGTPGTEEYMDVGGPSHLRVAGDSDAAEDWFDVGGSVAALLAAEASLLADHGNDGEDGGYLAINPDEEGVPAAFDEDDGMDE